ncbi:probable RNA-directed DNA polymerase from transposon BS [Trichonephila clavipes]|nr:probable RNA-directed DNA polymerase from transposon BS [Trichonephila clavipes]
MIANDEGVDEELLTRAFPAALPALRKLSHPDDKACEIFQAYVALKNGRNNLTIPGDLNAAHKTWNNTRSNNFGFRLKRIIQNYPNATIVAPYTPTHINSRSRPGGALGSIAVSPIEKAEVIADSLQKQFEPNTDVENPRFSAHIQRKVQRFLDSSTCMDLKKTSPSEIQRFIKNLKPNKSPGIDLITNRILKNRPTKFIIFIALQFNMLLENCYFPKSWKMAVVIPILKPNSDDSNPQNYGPISLLSSLSKAYELVILNRLNQHCLARNIIVPEQHGFVTKCSTVTQLLRVTELVHTGFQNHQSTSMLFVDIAKAFDKIWHNGLISKMMRLGFSDQILKIIHSYLNSREFRVKVENCPSSPRPVKNGIPQGSLLGPRLFNLYINDIPKADNGHLAMYADDTAIISQHTYNFKIIERLQNYITRIQLWLVAWKIKVNSSKRASLLFTKQRCIGNLPNIYIFDQPVPWVTEFKYLGFILDAKLNFSPTTTTSVLHFKKWQE